MAQIDQVSSGWRQKQKQGVKEGAQKKVRESAEEVKLNVYTAVIGRTASKNKG